IHEEEVSINLNNQIVNFVNNKEQNKSTEISISIAITEASCKM
ncbi:1695_t:CDS:1, partial [Cetraspora pellucida]